MTGNIKKFNPFAPPSPVMMARIELEEAQRQLLATQSAAEYARRLSEYHQDRIKRLSAFLKQAHTLADTEAKQDY